MRTKFLYMIVFVCLAYFSNAQNIDLLNATQRDWAGGVAGLHGSNYTIELQTSDYHVVPDTVWVGTMPFRLDSIGLQPSIERNIDSVHHKIEYILTISEGYHDNVSANYYATHPYHPGPKNVAIKQYTGAALITYMYKHKQGSFIIKEFKILPALNYP